MSPYRFPTSSFAASPRHETLRVTKRHESCRWSYLMRHTESSATASVALDRSQIKSRNYSSGVRARRELTRAGRGLVVSCQAPRDNSAAVFSRLRFAGVRGHPYRSRLASVEDRLEQRRSQRMNNPKTSARRGRYGKTGGRPRGADGTVRRVDVREARTVRCRHKRVWGGAPDRKSPLCLFAPTVRRKTHQFL